MQKSKPMSQQPTIKFVAYLATGDHGSTQFMSHYNRLPPGQQATIQIQDYHSVVATLGAKRPRWLRGFPTMVTYEDNPSVWEGSIAVGLMQEWASQMAGAASSSDARMTGAEDQGMSSMTSNPAEREMSTVAQTVDNEYGRGGSLVTDDLYQSHMPNKTSGGGRGGGAGKISDADVAAYNSMRSSSAAVRSREAMAQGRM